MRLGTSRVKVTEATNAYTLHFLDNNKMRTFRDNSALPACGV
jgi:hypothetical protein